MGLVQCVKEPWEIGMPMIVEKKWFCRVYGSNVLEAESFFQEFSKPGDEAKGICSINNVVVEHDGHSDTLPR
jgi:hypothetical protein